MTAARGTPAAENGRAGIVLFDPPETAPHLHETGRAMTAQEAERLGMVTEVVPLDDLRAEIRVLAAEIGRPAGNGD